MSAAGIESLAEEQFLYLTTIGRVSGEPHEIEIWFIVHDEKFYLFAEHGEAAGWVKNIRRNKSVSVRIGKRRIMAVARVIDQRKERELGDEVQAIATRKYGWGEGLPVAIAPANASRTG